VQVEQPCLPNPRYATDTSAANYAYENPTTNGHTMAAPTDDGSFAINLPWSFQYFCKSYSYVHSSLSNPSSNASFLPSLVEDS
jgi:hypothetical protein